LAAQTHKLLRGAFGDDILGIAKTYEWFTRLKKKKVRMSGNDDERFWTTSDVNWGRTFGKTARGYPRRPKVKVCDIVKLSHGTHQRIVSKCVPRLLGHEHKELL
jgi:hypothetical protein